MSDDEQMRRLQRLAATGDTSAAARLAQSRCRRVGHQWSLWVCLGRTWVRECIDCRERDEHDDPPGEEGGVYIRYRGDHDTQRFVLPGFD